MWCCNSMHEVCDYASMATYRECPNIEQIRNGVVPLDSLPAAWWNWMWWDTNKAVNEARSAVGMFLNELNCVLTEGNVTAVCTCVNNIYCAIENIRTRLGSALVAGAVKSSACGGQVTIENDGTMTMNGVGNAANLTTTSKQVVGAINELKSTYDCCFTDTGTALGGKAPNAHASTATTYGVGNANCYGHLKISDTYDQVLTACSGVAASQKALACVYSAMTGAGYTTLGSTVGCALGTAAAGSATTAARSDHVHPKQTCVACAGKIKRNACTNAYLFTVALTNGCSTADGTDLYASCKCPITFCSTTGVLTTTIFCGNVCGLATCASKNGSGTAFGTAATVNTGTAANCIPLIGTALGTTNNNIVVTDTNGALKPSGTTLKSAAGKTAGSAAGNVPLVGTALGTTDGQLVATDAAGKLKPSGYTASCFLGATSKACCAEYSDRLYSVFGSACCGVAIYNGSSQNIYLAGTYNSSLVPVRVSEALNAFDATCATLSCCAKCIHPEITNALCTPNAGTICNKCSFAVLAFNSHTGCVLYLGSKKCVSANEPSCFGTTALGVV